jgi:hypothetical protein
VLVRHKIVSLTTSVAAIVASLGIVVLLLPAVRVLLLLAVRVGLLGVGVLLPAVTIVASGIIPLVVGV